MRRSGRSRSGSVPRTFIRKIKKTILPNQGKEIAQNAFGCTEIEADAKFIRERVDVTLSRNNAATSSSTEKRSASLIMNIHYSKWSPSNTGVINAKIQ